MPVVEIVHKGCPIRYRRFGTPESTPVLLVHGGGAHAGWWSDVAPRLAANFSVIVPDLSGHGDSGHRDTYSPRLWAHELAAVLRAEGASATRFVGHSMGGQIGIVMAAELPDVVSSLLLIDPILREPDSDHGSETRGRGWHATSIHATAEAALERFRLGRTTAAPDVIRRVAELGLRRVPEGWTWKFDPRVSRRFTDDLLHEALKRVSCAVGLIYGEKSPFVSPSTVAYLVSRLGREVPATMIPDAFHHVPLDQPATCSEAIEDTLHALDELGTETT